MSVFLFWRRPPDADDRFEALLAPHIDHLYRLAYRFTGLREEAEDLVQDLLVKLYPRQTEIASIDKLRPWLAQVLYRLFIDNIRQARRSVLSEVDDSNDVDAQLDPGRGPEEQVEGALTQQRLLAAFAQLNEDQRALLALHDIEGYTLQELVNVLDTPIGTLKSRLNRAHTKLREYLAREPFGIVRRVYK